MWCPLVAAAAAGIKPTIYGRSQATGDFIRRLYQIDPAKASQMEVTQLQIGDLQDKSQRRNSLKEVDLAVGQWANQAAPKDEQGRPVMTDDFMVNLGKKRVFELANRGLFDEAMQSANEAMQYATRKIQAEQAARQAAVRDAVAAAAMGDYSKALETYNQYVPDGSKATRVVQNKDGSFTVERVSAVDGTPLPPGRFKDSDHFISSLRMLEDSGALASYIDRTFRHDIESRKLALDERREGRLSAESRDKRDAERAKADAAAALFKELNPNATVAQIEAVRRGVITAVPKDEGYKTEFNEVANALGQPATDKKGRPIMDPVTGRQLINRDPAAEAAFFNWMQKSGIKDTNKALQLYLANRSGAGRPSEAEAIEQAKAAIARGADKEAVNARLRQWGYREIR
jgi:tetratricopeptide (TPR) repeat protein